MKFNFNSFTQNGGGDNNKILVISLIVAIIFFVFIMPAIEKYYNKDRQALVEKLENIMANKIDTNKCSRSCCLTNSWPYPEELQPNDMSADELKNYIPSNYSCNFGSNNGGGCVCVTKDNYEFLGSRGGNGPSNCNN